MLECAAFAIAIKKEKERKLIVKLSKKSEIKKNAEVQTEVVGNTSGKEIQADIQYKCDICEFKPTKQKNVKGPIEPLHETMGTDKKDDNSNLASEVKVKVEFQKYPCYYCGINIAGEYHLEQHRYKCRGWPTSLTLYNKIYFDLPLSFKLPSHRMPTNYRPSW